MKEKVAAFFLDNGFKIMMTGFAVSAAGIVWFIREQHRNQFLRKIAFGMTAAGIALYIIGRICVIVQQRRARRLREQALIRGSENGEDT